MRRGCQVTISGGGGYSKPPPGPLSHATAGRMRLHSLDVNGAVMKDRFGSPRERSPSVGSSMPLSPSHLSSREKSPNPTSQDLHDCSMCLSAYIQSLNTVCGTACRLSQCLSQVGADSWCSSDPSGSGAPLHQMLKEAAELWEGIARAVGVASTSVKNQLIHLLQETQTRHTVAGSEATRKQEVAKLMRTLLSTFLTLHCQFSLVVVERFSGMIQLLKDDNCGSGAGGAVPGHNGIYCMPNSETGGAPRRPSPSPSVSPHHPSPPPQTQFGNQLPTQQQVPAQQQLASQQQLPTQQLPTQQQLLTQQHMQALQQQMLLQHMLQLNSKAIPADGSVALNEDGGSRHSSGGSASALQAPLWGANLGSPINSYSSQNTLSPGNCAVLGGDIGSDNISRRWSMGGASEEACHDKVSSLLPFSLIANRRWSVPETIEHDPPHSAGGLGGLTPLYGSEHGRNTHNRGYAPKGNHQMLSREGSCTRSPSHSRSVTPDQSRRVSVVSNEELQDIIDLLSMPLGPRDERGPSTFPSKPSAARHLFPSASQKGLEEGSLAHPHSIPENEPEGPHGERDPLSLLSHHDMQSDKGKDDAVLYQQKLWHENAPPTAGGPRKGSDEGVHGHSNQISTSLWPPTENVPGVTLTECLGDTDKNSIPPWADELSCPENNRSAAEVFNRDSANRSSCPFAAFPGLGIMDEMFQATPGGIGPQGGWGQRPNMAAFRRHSTDAPFFLPQGWQPPLAARTRSFENLASKVNGNNNSSPDPESAVRDLYMPPFQSFSAASSPTTSHYTLFTTSS